MYFLTGALAAVRGQQSHPLNATPVQGGAKFSEKQFLTGLHTTGSGTTDRGELWWTWTAPTNGVVTIDNLGSEAYTSVRVYVGSSIDNLLLVRMATYNAEGQSLSIVSNQVVVGTVYQIQLAVPFSIQSRGPSR